MQQNQKKVGIRQPFVLGATHCCEKCVVMCMLSTLGFGLFHLCLFFLTAVMRFRTDAFFALHRDRFSDLSQKLSPH